MVFSKSCFAIRSAQIAIFNKLTYLLTGSGRLRGQVLRDIHLKPLALSHSRLNSWYSVFLISDSWYSVTVTCNSWYCVTVVFGSWYSVVVISNRWYSVAIHFQPLVLSCCHVHQLVLSRFHFQEPVLGYSRLQQLVLGHVQEPYSVAVVFSRSTVSPPRSRCGRWSPVTTSSYHYPTRRSSASHRSSYSTCLTDVRTEPEVPELGETGTGSETETVSLSGASFVRLASLEQLDLSHNRLEVIQRQAPA